jgi:hypothetical protein
MLVDIIANLRFGLDSLIVCTGLGSLCGSRRTWLLLAIAFGAADGAGGLLGQAIAWPHISGALALVAPILVAAYGGLVLIATANIRTIATSRFGLACLPTLFSLDNFFAGASEGADPSVEPAIAMTVATTIMALAGCGLGSLLVARWPTLKRPLPGAAALAAALIMGAA